MLSSFGLLFQKLLLYITSYCKRKIVLTENHFWRQMIWKSPLIFLITLRQPQPFLTRISMSHEWNQALSLSLSLFEVCELWYVPSAFIFLLLNLGRSIMAVSSWNDNGQKQFVHDPCKFFSPNRISFAGEQSSLMHFYVQDLFGLIKIWFVLASMTFGVLCYLLIFTFGAYLKNWDGLWL